MSLEEIIEAHNALRTKCLELAKRDNGRLLGEYAWLRFSIQESDISLEYLEDGISCYGSAFSTQTVSSEWFSFTIPFSELC